MEKIKRKCCICGKEFKGWGNNPWGALDQDCKQIEWSDDDCCCNECNAKYVIPGRLANMYRLSKDEIRKVMPTKLIKRERK